MKDRAVRFLRRNFFQPFWEKLFRMAKVGMNFYGGASVNDSGEIHALEYAKSRSPNGQGLQVFDVGAHTGGFAFMALGILPESTMIRSFEPSRKTFEMLQENIRSKNAAERIQAFQLGLGSENATLQLHNRHDGSSIASIHVPVRNVPKFDPQLTEEIQIRTIDGFCREAGIDRIDYLKIDVEGHEYAVMLGARRMIDENRIRFIQFEFGECHIDSRTFFRDIHTLLAPHYTLHRIVGNGLRRVPRYSTDLEVFDTVNYLAELGSDPSVSG